MANVIKGEEVVKNFLVINKKNDYKAYNRVPKLSIIRVGESESEKAYERSVMNKLVPLGIECVSTVLEESVNQDVFDQTFNEINQDEEIHGILLLKPVPKHISLAHVIETINPKKDVDCIGATNMARIYQEGKKGFIPCTAEAVMQIINFEEIDLKGKSVVMVGFGMVIGRPLTLLLVEAGSTVTVCNEFTKDLKQESSRADVLIVATGVKHLIEENHVKQDAVVIDVGINVDEDGRIVGDVDFDAVSKKAGSITPVPGGVGTVTTYVLADHVFKAFELQQHS